MPKNQNVGVPLTNQEGATIRGKNPLIDLFVYTGMRLEEAKYMIDNGKLGHDVVDVPRKGTNENKCRIYLSELAIECLKKVQELYKDVSSKTIYRAVVAGLDEHKIEAHPHCLRATFATQLLQNGVDLVRVSELMNHSDLSTTAAYIKFDEANLRAALNIFNPKYALDGMTTDELKQEIIKLRGRLNRNEGSNE